MKRGKKASAIREYLSQHPNASTKEVIEGLAAQRIKVTPTQVYGLKSVKPKLDPIDSLVRAKKMADALGGVDKAREAMDALARILA